MNVKEQLKMFPLVILTMMISLLWQSNQLFILVRFKNMNKKTQQHKNNQTKPLILTMNVKIKRRKLRQLSLLQLNSNKPLRKYL